MELKTIEVIKMNPSMTYVTYHVEAVDADEAERLVDEFDESVEKIGEHTSDNVWDSIEYDVNEL
jgi:hypothetical protein